MTREQSTLKLEPIGKIGAGNEPHELPKFLGRKLSTKQVTYVVRALETAGARYDRYTARRDEWLDYATRRNRIKFIIKLTSELTAGLSELDVVSRDDLATRADQKKIEVLLGSLTRLGAEMCDLLADVQDNGRPRDLAEERWMLELADIYENAFGQPAGANRTMFCRLLELSRPSSFPRHGKLNPRQIGRTLKRRRKRRRGIDIAS
jgi:hypothetical protein